MVGCVVLTFFDLTALVMAVMVLGDIQCGKRAVVVVPMQDPSLLTTSERRIKVIIDPNQSLLTLAGPQLCT